jgi:hypothetical protein
MIMAKTAYDAYCKAVGGKAFNGDPLPEFGATPERIQNAWKEAVTPVANAALTAGLILSVPLVAILILAIMGIISLFR